MTDNLKESYIIQYRNGLWKAVREKESNCWKFLAFYMPAVSVIFTLGQTHLSSEVIVLALFILTSWGILVAIDANFWNRRNIKIISNIESKYASFIYRDKILPKSYAKPSYRYVLTYRTIIRMLNVVCLSILLWFISIHRSNNLVFNNKQWLPVFIGVTAICFWLLYENGKRQSDYNKFEKETENGTTNSSSNSSCPQVTNLMDIRFLDNPVVYCVISSLQIISIGIIYSSSYPQYQNTVLYYIVISWPYFGLLVLKIIMYLIGKIKKLKTKKVFLAINRWIQYVVMMFCTIVIWIWAVLLLIN